MGEVNYKPGKYMVMTSNGYYPTNPGFKKWIVQEYVYEQQAIEHAKRESAKQYWTLVPTHWVQSEEQLKQTGWIK